MLRIVTADNHPIVLEMLAKSISKHKDMQLVGSADHGSKLPDLVGQHSPNVAILGVGGMDLGGFDPTACMIYLRKHYPDVKILLLSGYDLDPARADELSERIDETIQRLDNGLLYNLSAEKPYNPNHPPIAFTQQEKSVLRLIMDEGKSIPATAHTLGISEKSIQDLMKRMLDNAGIKVPKTPRIRLRHKKKPASPA